MSYSLNINQGNNTVSIPSRKALAGYTLKLVLDRGGSSAPVEITSGLTVSGQSVIAAIGSRLSDFSGSDYILQGTKNGSTDVLQNGHIYSVKADLEAGADDVNVVNTPAVTVANPTTTVTVANPVNTVTVANPVNTVAVSGTVPVSGTVAISNPVNTVSVSGTVPVSGTVNTVPPTTGTLVGTIQNKVREEFPGSALDPTMWDIIQTGAGQTVAVTASELRIDSGTTANATTIIRSKKAYTGAYRVMFVSAAALLSQRIANHEVQLRMTNAAGTSYSAWVFNGTTATTGVLRSQAGGTLGVDQTNTAVSSTATTSIYELENFIDEVYFHSRASDSTNARSSTNVKNRLTPDPNEDMFIEIRVINGATAPASTTRLSIDSILIQDISELTTEITGGRGGGGASQALPVVSAANLNVAIQGNPRLDVAGSDTTVSTTAQAANATMTGATIDGSATTGTRNNRAWIQYSATAAALGSIAHLVYQESLDGTTWREQWRAPVPADGSMHSFEVAVRQRYRRWLVINGSTAQTALFVYERAMQFNGPTDQDLNISYPLTPAAGQALAASAQFTSPTFDLGANHMWDRVRVLAFSDQATSGGGLYIQQSVDASTFMGPTGVQLTASGVQLIENTITSRYLRIGLVNGSTAATSVRIVLSLVSL